ncbi:hypothetical protein WBP07_12800 [Novosphingobium sp. BL-8A]|uniref:hypothetical protein n=1 Tax=Novosphingobium sp. BL-8A TaxID=3127639 RepID=UPI00375663D6
MTNQPEQAWVEAARTAAQRTYESLGDMTHLDLGLQVVDKEDATGTNSLDRDFLDYLVSGKHLTDSFLANAQ